MTILQKKFIKLFITLFVWVFTIIKLFIFDLDIYLIKLLAPEMLFLTSYKFFIFTAIISLIWLLLGQKKFFHLMAYIVFFPLTLTLWYFPVLLFKSKSWNFVFACIDAITSSFISFKYNFITMTIFSIALLLTFISYNHTVLWISALVLFTLTIMAYVRKLYFVIKPSTMYTFLSSALCKLVNQSEKSFRLEDELRVLSVQTMNDSQLKMWSESLEKSVLYNRFCLFTASKLRSYQRSGLNIVAYILMILILISLTVISFSAINLSLYKIEPLWFETIKTPSFFTFFYYSFNNMMINTIQDITPVGVYAQTAQMAQFFFVVFFLALIITLFFSFRAQKHTEELDDSIEIIKKEGMRIEYIILDEFSLQSIDEAIHELEKIKSSSIKLIISLTRNLS
jgi:hypothetical protein